MPAPTSGDVEITQLTDAYDEHYDPNWGALDAQAIRRRYSMGQNT